MPDRSPPAHQVRCGSDLVREERKRSYPRPGCRLYALTRTAGRRALGALGRLDAVPRKSRPTERGQCGGAGKSRWVVCLAALAGAAALSAQTVQEMVAQGDEALRARRYDVAIRLYDDARGLVDPARTRLVAGLLFKKALAFREAGEVLAAIATVELAQHYHADEAYEQVRAALDLEAIESVADSQEIVNALGLAKGFPPTSALPPSVSVWVDFEFDSADLTRRGERQLGEMAQAMANEAFRENRFLLVGHTDARGSETYNLDLSERRAHMVWTRLVHGFGLKAARIDVEGRGEGEPRARGSSESAHARNRRVELKLLR